MYAYRGQLAGQRTQYVQVPGDFWRRLHTWIMHRKEVKSCLFVSNG